MSQGAVGKPTQAKAQIIVRDFWRTVEHGGTAEAVLRENPWLVFERSAKTSSYKNEPFLAAVIHHNRKDLVDLGLRLGAPLEDRDDSGRTPLFCLVEATGLTWADDKWDYVDRMVAAGARCDTVNAQGSPLWVAMGADGPAEWLDRFIAGGSPLDTVDALGKPGLSTLIERSFNTAAARESAVALVGHGADVNFFPAHQMSLAPIVCALLATPHDMADLLLEHGADLQRKDSLGRTFLHLAVNGPMVKWLHGHGVDLEARDRLGRTPLLAILQDHLSQDIEETATALVVAGADLNARDSQSTSLCAGDLIRADPKRFPHLIDILNAVQARAVAHRTLDEIRGFSP